MARNKRTSWDLPHATFGDAEFDVAHIHCDSTLMYEEDHLHFAGVLHAFVTFRWDFNHSCAEKGHGHDFGIPEGRALNVACRDGGRCKGNVCRNG